MVEGADRNRLPDIVPNPALLLFTDVIAIEERSAKQLGDIGNAHGSGG
jgi:hypothetical protein